MLGYKETKMIEKVFNSEFIIAVNHFQNYNELNSHVIESWLQAVLLHCPAKMFSCWVLQNIIWKGMIKYLRK